MSHKLLHGKAENKQLNEKSDERQEQKKKTNWKRKKLFLITV